MQASNVSIYLLCLLIKSLRFWLWIIPCLKTFSNPDIHNDFKHAMSVWDLVWQLKYRYFLKHPV